MNGHEEANAELLECTASFGPGAHVVFAGDLNCHTGANGDTALPDRAGRLFMSTAEQAGLHIINLLPPLCSDEHTRVEVKTTGVERSTIDYVCCSSSVLPLVKSLVFHSNTMGSDHKPLVLSLGGVVPTTEGKSLLREVWRMDKIPTVFPGDAYSRGDWSWVRSCQAQFRQWAHDTPALIAALEGMGADSEALANVYDWSFQTALETVAEAHIGKKVVGPKAAPQLCATVAMLVDQRRISEAVLTQVTDDPDASEETRFAARTQFLRDRRAATRGLKDSKRIADLELFTGVEQSQADTKLFWSRVKAMRGSRAGNKAPPPVATGSDGATESDPQRVLEIWRSFSAGIASRNPPAEEGIYDEQFRSDTQAELERLRAIRLHQDELDHPITDSEVFAALRALRPGTAPGRGGLQVDMLRSAADAANNGRLRGDNSVVSAISMMFNFVLDRECWPSRWAEGDIVPLYKGKGSSRLDPGNYRPITLLSVVGKLFGFVINRRLVAFTEATGLTADEQGGFRPFRGTPDQIMIMREGIAARSEIGFQTLALFVDVRKAYDTVWRERAYVDLHKAGIKGKLWRQLQAMQANMKRKVRTPVGDTPSFGVERGAAQGAVESPWFYSAFLNPLAEALRERGLGIMIGGKRVPLLMYADDIVLLANGPTELRAMCAVCTEFAKQRRFQVNGPKCGIVQFGANANQRAVVAGEQWEIFGEQVKVLDSYEYLGSVTSTRIADWSPHVRALVAKAKARSRDLLWMCRAGNGMRSRTVVVLFNALVRPILEYCAVLWGSSIGAGLVREIEAVQSAFLRAISGVHKSGMGVSNDFLRAEHGVELLAARRAKLKAGFWRRLHTVAPQRILRSVLALRYHQVRADNAILGSRSLLRSFRLSLVSSGLGQFWDDPGSAVRIHSEESWKRFSSHAIDEVEDNARAHRMADSRSLNVYIKVKSWGVNDIEHSAYSGEQYRLGFRVPEPYLDDRDSPHGTVRLKLLARAGALPLMDRIGRERGWPLATRICPMCGIGEVEDTRHVVLFCPSYDSERRELRDRIEHAGSRQGEFAPGASHFSDLAAEERLLIVLGKRIGNAMVERGVDLAVKMFLSAVWRKRDDVRVSLNNLLHRNDS
jgi:hypothetical protein